MNLDLLFYILCAVAAVLYVWKEVLDYQAVKSNREFRENTLARLEKLERHVEFLESQRRRL